MISPETFERLARKRTRPITDTPGLPPEKRRPAAVLAIADLSRPDPGLLFLKRPDTMKSHAGQIAFPGGRCEPSESYLEAALRETHEEVGIKPEHLEPIGWIDPVWTVGSDYWVVPYVARLHTPVILTPNSHEVDETFWVGMNQFLDQHRHRPMPVHSPGFRATIDYWDVDTPYGTRTVWGATGAMMRTLIESVREMPLKKE